MAISYGFFNSVNGDRTYNADDISNYFLKLISNGVFATPSNAMQVQENGGMTVQVTPGWGFINCKWIKNDSPYLLTLDAADVVLNRIDRIVLRLNAATSARSMSIAIKKGTSASNPVAPGLTRTAGGIWELSIARIYVGAGVTSISQANITDERPDTSVCGYVTGLIDQIDTTNLFAQYDSAFNTWFDEIKEEVRSTSIVVKYNRLYYTLTANESVIPVDISEYNRTLDILNVYINGMRLVASVDYTETNGIVTLTKPLTVIGTAVEFEVLKSVDIGPAESIVNLVVQLEQRVNALTDAMGGMSFVQCTLTEYTNMITHSPTTLYTTIDGAGNVVQFLGDVQLKSGSSAPVGYPIGQISGLTNSVIGTATAE